MSPRGLPLTLLFATPPHPTGTWASARPALILIGVLIVGTVLAGLLWMFLRRKVLEKETDKNISVSLMEQLRAMHKRGEISDAEFERTRKSIASRVSESLGVRGTNEPNDEAKFKARPARSQRPGGETPPKPGSPTSDPDDRRAPPGYDLTGEPLPEPRDGA